MDSFSIQIVLPAFYLSSGIALYFGIHSLIMATSKEQIASCISLSLFSFSIAGYQISTGYYYQAANLTQGATALKFQAASIAILVPSLFAFLSFYTGYEKTWRWLAPLTAFFGFLFFVNIFTPYSLRFESLRMLEPLRFPWGETISQFSGTFGLWHFPVLLIYSIIIYFLFGRSLVFLRLNNILKFSLLTGTLFLFVLGPASAYLIDTGKMHSFYMTGFAYIGIALLLSIGMAQDHKKGREILEEALQRIQRGELELNSLFKVAPVAITLLKDRKVVKVNDYMTTLTGYSREELVGDTLGKIFVSEAENERIAREFYSNIKKIGISVFEATNRRKDGSHFQVLVTGTLVNPGDEASGYVSTAMDITELKKARQATEVAEKRYREIFENALEGIFQTSPDGKLLMCNPTLAAMFGFDSPEEMRLAMQEGIHFYVKAEKRSELIELLNGRGVIRGFVSQFFRKDGRIIWGSVNARAVRGAEGKPVYFEGTFEDITQQKELEEAYFAAEKRYRNIFENSVEGIFQCSFEGDWLLVNPAAATILGLKSTERKGDFKPTSALLLFGNERWLDFSQRLLKEGYIKGYELQFYRNDRSRTWVSVNAKVISDYSGTIHHYEGTIEDITLRKELEAQFVQAQKMEVIGQLAGGIAHDFNNILTVINGFTSLLLLESGLDPKVEERIRQIHQAGEKGAKLTRQLLTFGQKRPLQIQSVDLNAAIRSTVGIIRQLIGENIALELMLSEPLPMIDADSGMMEQVLLNLSINARDAMAKGGKLTISTGAVRITSGDLAKYRNASEGEFVTISIKDTGEGIAPEVRERIFEPFFTTKEAGKGTGLGLSTVYTILKSHHGWIEVLSQVGKGTEFQIFFPISQPTLSEEVSDRPDEEIKGGDETILVVEDDPSVMELTRSILERYGYRVLGTDSGEEALKIYEKFRQEIALVVSDLLICGGLNGIDLINAIKVQWPDIRALCISADPDRVLKTLSDHWNDFPILTKPFSPEVLAKAVRTALDNFP